MVKCLVFHKQAASSYTLPEKLSLRRGFKEKVVDLPLFGVLSLAKNYILISSECKTRDLVKTKASSHV